MEDEKTLHRKAISYAMYPKVYEDYCRHFEAYNDVTRLESHVYFYGLRKGEETTLTIGEGEQSGTFRLNNPGNRRKSPRKRGRSGNCEHAAAYRGSDEDGNNCRIQGQRQGR